MPRPRRTGFTLVEAVVVLAITGALLVVVFSVGAGGTRAGFRLAEGAVSSADRSVGEANARVLLRGLRPPAKAGATTPLVGEPEGLVATVSPVRSTGCTGFAEAVIQLRIERAAGRSRLICARAGGKATAMMDLGPSPAGFSYALAGRPWTTRMRAELAPEPAGRPASPAPRPRLWVRLASEDGAVDIIEAIDLPPKPAKAAS